MRAVAKWFLGRCTAATKRHPFFHRKFVAVGVDQFHFAGHDVSAVLNCFDFYHNAPNLTLSAHTASRSDETPSMRPGSISLGQRAVAEFWGEQQRAGRCILPRRTFV